MKIYLNNFTGLRVPWPGDLPVKTTATERAVFGLVDAFEGIGVGAVARALAVTTTRSIEHLSALTRKGLIRKKVWTAESLKEAVISRRFAHETCQWCSNRCVSLQEHHFPIQKHKGGRETVFICALCHSDYHALTTSYEVNQP